MISIPNPWATSLVSALTLLFSSSLYNAEIDSDQYRLGKQLYSQGILPNGNQVKAVVQGDIAVQGDQLICETCHRRSGMGSTEGQEVVPAIAGHILFNPLQLPTSKPPAPPIYRQAYTRETLLRAITQGIDANGQTMSPFMPRYEIDEPALDVLMSYLDTLSQSISPGVTDTEIHFATILLDSNKPEDNRALMDVLENYFEQKNVETRHESKRAEHAPWHKEWMFKPYRKWHLHTWQLSGPESGWADQLQAYMLEQPVFAVLNGLVPVGWPTVHQFCEENALPCLFPTTQTPELSELGFYNLYLDRGVVQDAEALAAYLATTAEVTQVYDPTDTLSTQAAERFRGRMSHAGRAVRDITLDQSAQADSLIGSKPGSDTLVFWTGRNATQTLLQKLGKAGDQSPLIYLSTRFYGTQTDALPTQWREHIRFVHSQEMPDKLNHHLLRSTGWFKSKRIYNPQAKEIQANAYFALKAAGDALKQIRGYFYRDYFIEKIEHMVDDLPYTSIYPRVSMAPGQRFASRGFYIAKVDGQGGNLVRVTEWKAP
ncbi:MAG: hypothetical protein ABW095_13100 [Candidatus Thiodiazotropha sp.]